MEYRSTKTFGHELGLSAVFRQWRAKSHCRLLHGYALSFRFTFGCKTLDARNWVQDFGALQKLKLGLSLAFDHKVVVAADDPERDLICSLAGLDLASVVVLPAVGCEAFAQYGFDLARQVLAEQHQDGRVWVLSCEVSEHGSNSAIYSEE